MSFIWIILLNWCDYSLGKTSKYPTKDSKRWQRFAGELTKLWYSFSMQEYAEVWQTLPTVYKKTKCIENNSLMSSPRVTFNLTCGKSVTECQNLSNLGLSSFAESNQMQQKNFDVSPRLFSDTVCRSGFRPWDKICKINIVVSCKIYAVSGLGTKSAK